MKSKTALFLAAGLVFAGNPMIPVMANDPATTAASDPDQAIKCRKVEVTGSLVRKGKVCKTVAEWKAIQDNGNRTARAIAESGYMCSGGDCGNGN
jgi:hypothetical protein